MRVAIAFSGRQLLAIMLLACALFLHAAPAHAKNTRLDACVAPARASDNATQIIWQAAKFDCRPTQSSLQPGDYWVRFDVPESAQPKGKGLLLRTASLWDEGLELWAVHGDGFVAHYEPFARQSISPMRLGATVVVPIKSRDAPVTLLLAKVKNSAAVRGVMLESQLSTSESAITFEMAMAVLYAGFSGACLALLVYNIALWRAMRERFLLAYCAMLVTTLAYGIFTSGAPHYFIAGLSGANRLAFTIPLLAYCASSALIFMRYFFENANVPRWLARATFAHAAWMSGFATLYALAAPAYVKQLDLIYVYSFLPVPVIFGTYVWTAWKHRDPFLGYFLIAWSGPAVSAAFRMLHGFDILPYHILIENSTLLGLTFEAVVSSLAIGYRVRLLAQARDRAEIAEAHAMTMADTDPLTGLLNRRAFLRSIMERNSNWTLLLLDIDHFKRVNDSLGHAGGDEAITLLAATLQRRLPNGSLLARMGGEEFAIAYRGDMLLIEPDELLAQIRKIDLKDGYRMTASMGIANRNVASDDDWKILYRAADMALYRAKSQGRDRFARVQPQSQAA
jgi:diguanylate cyclase (GGDEF)-like protein